MAELRRALDAGDIVTAKRIAHSRKGTSATLGLEPLRQLATELEAALPDASPQQIEVLAAAIEQQTTALANALGLQPGLAPLPTPSTEEARAILSRISNLLELDDVCVGQLVRESSSLLRATLGPAAQRFQQQVAAFEYRQALNILRAALGPGDQDVDT